MSSALDNLTLRNIVEEAEAIIRRLFPDKREEPAGLKLELVRALRKAESRGMQAVVEHFGICDDCSPVPNSVANLADATKKDTP